MLTPQSPILVAAKIAVRRPDGKARGSSSDGDDPPILPPSNGAGSDPSLPAPSQHNPVSTRQPRREQQRQSNSTDVAVPSQNRNNSRRKNQTQNEEVSLCHSSRRRSCNDDAEESQPSPKKQKTKDEPNEAEQNSIESPSSAEDDDLSTTSTTPVVHWKEERNNYNNEMKRLFLLHLKKHGVDISCFGQSEEEDQRVLTNEYREMFEHFKESLQRQNYESRHHEDTSGDDNDNVESNMDDAVDDAVLLQVADDGMMPPSKHTKVADDDSFSPASNNKDSLPAVAALPKDNPAQCLDDPTGDLTSPAPPRSHSSSATPTKVTPLPEDEAATGKSQGEVVEFNSCLHLDDGAEDDPAVANEDDPNEDATDNSAMRPTEGDVEMSQVDDAEVDPPSSIIHSSFMALGDDNDKESRQQFYQFHGEKFERMMSCLEKIEEWTHRETRASFVLRFAKELYSQFLESHEAESHADTQEDEEEGPPNHNPQDEDDDEPAGEEEDRYYVDVVYDEDLSDDEDEDESPTSAYTATYCLDRKVTSEKQFREIMLCYEHGMDDINNDTKDKWNELYRLVLLERGEAPPTKDYARDRNPLRRSFYRTSYHRSTSFNKCRPHPIFDPLRVGDIELFEGYTVRQCTHQLIRPLRDKTFEVTGEKQAVFPRSDRISKKGSPKTNFFEKGGRYALLATEISSLKNRVSDSNSYIAKLILNYMKTKGGLCLDNRTAYDEYRSGRKCDDGRVMFYLGILYHCAGIELLPKMAHYDILGIVDKLYEEVVNHSKYLALQPLMEFQRQLVARLKEDINRIDEYRLMSDPKEYLIYKLCKMIWDDMPVLEDNPGVDFRQSLSLLQAAHIGDEGRRAKQEIADGKSPSDCDFDLLLKQDRYLKLLCGEVHLGELDLTGLAAVASGADERLGSVPVKALTGYSYKQIFRARVLYLLMYKLSVAGVNLIANISGR